MIILHWIAATRFAASDFQDNPCRLLKRLVPYLIFY